MLTKSTMLPLGSKIPDFSLKDVVSGKTVSLSDFSKKKAILVMFICNHCPFVKHVQKELSKLGKDYKYSDLGMVAISANDADNYPSDSPEELKKQAVESGFTFPYLYDETQKTAKTFTAACTPDFFLFDESKKLVYRGQLDDSRPGKVWVKVTGNDLRDAIKKTLSGEKINPSQKPSSGCNIKWKKGQEPDYF